MKAYFATNLVGAFAFDQKGKLLGYRLFPKEPEKIKERLEKAGQGMLVPEEQELFKELQAKGLAEVVWNKKVCLPGVQCAEEGWEKCLSGQFRKLALELKWVGSEAELNSLLAQVSVLQTKGKLKEEKRDRILMASIGVADELDKSLNVFSERLREWYGLHFPELGKLVPSQETFANIVSAAGNRENVKEEKAEKYKTLTSGMQFTEEDSAAVQEFAKELSALYNSKSVIEVYIGKAAKQAIPNLSAIAGPLLACRLLALSGGLEKLAKMPSSTVQLLGAEKALFRHLKGGGKAPKYGILFSHPLVQNATKPERGKIARLIAAKLSIAAKTDFFSGEDRSAAMKADLERKLKH